MSLQIKKVTGLKDLKRFIRFPFSIYKDCPNWVPALDGDEFDTLTPLTNGAFEYCDAEKYLCYKDGVLAGRVAAIVNHKANELWNENSVRFGWLDFIEDEEVLRALISAVEDYGRSFGCKYIKGPWGFTDMDKEGLLVEGFDKLSPFTCLYNYPYYSEMLERIGFKKDVDWTQRLLNVSADVPSLYSRVDLIEERYGLHIAKARSIAEFGRKYGMSIFHMYNESFAPLFEFTPLSDRQIRRYLQTYVPILSRDFVAVVVDKDDNPVGFAFCVPSLSKAVKASDGRLFPLGLFRILKALRKNDTLEALMIGVLPKYHGMGASLLLLKHIHENCLKRGIKRVIMNPQLEQNTKVQSLFNQYAPEPFLRRRAYIKEI